MATFAEVKDAGKVVGFTISTQFNLESSQKLFSITGPKKLEWKYPKASGNAAPPDDVIAEHVQAVRDRASKKWRSGFKNDVKKRVVKEIKPLEKLYQANLDKITERDQKKREAAELKIKTGVETIAAAKAETIVEEEFGAFMEATSATCISAMGTKGKKLKKAGIIALKGTAVLAVSAVGITASALSFGSAAVPALTATGLIISGIIASGGAIRTYQSSRKEFRAAQDKLSKSTASVSSALETALRDAQALKLKWDKVSLRLNAVQNEVAKLEKQEKLLSAHKTDDPQVKKIQKQVKELTDDLNADTAKLQAMTAGDPADYITALLAAQKHVKGMNIDADAKSHGRLDTAFGAVGNANSLAGAIGNIATS